MAGRARTFAGIALTAMLVVGACGSDTQAAPPEGSRLVTIPGPQGSELAARALGEGSTAVVLVHGASTDMTSWYGAMPGLAGAGHRVLAFDARGVGDSSGDREDDPAARAEDIGAAVRYARDHGATKVVVMGSSLGAIATLQAAARDDYAAIVGVSAPEEPGGLDEISEPALFVASKGDTYPAAATRALARDFGRDPVIVGGSTHGAGLFADHPGAVDALVAFLAEVAPAR